MPCTHSIISRVIAIAALTLTAAGSVRAQLQDHGPGDPALSWPLWYRDLGGLALRLCRSTTPMCFPLPPEGNGFPGNIGSEVFYFNLDMDINTTDVQLRYIAALEATYGNGAGTPVRGEEILFTRIRFVMDVNTPECAGDYTIVHPYGRKTYANVPTGKRALVDTLDVPLGAFGDFDGALRGTIGPFLRWDDGAGGPAPLLTVGSEVFVGDPNVLHSFLGSPFVDPSNGEPQNFLELIGPASCNLDGAGGNVVRETQGFLLGQVWTAPIPTPTRVTRAEYTRSSNAVAVDVWAATAPDNVLILSGTGMPSAQMVEEKATDGQGTGKYHANVQYSGDLVRSVTVTNASSNPIVQVPTSVVDAIDVTAAHYDRSRRELCVSARSLDQPPAPLLPPELIVENLGGGSVMTAGTCPANAAPAQPGEVALTIALPPGANGSAAVKEPPAIVSVRSTAGGLQDRNVLMGHGTPDNSANAPIASDDSFTLLGLSAQTLAIGGNDSPSNAGRVIVISPPALGTAVGNAAGGTVTYTPDPTKIDADSADTFSYVVQDAQGGVSNQATVQLNIVFVDQPPVANPDVLAVARTSTTGKAVDVAVNDTTPVGTALDRNSIVIGQQGARGTAKLNANGTVTYVPLAGATAGTDFFTYTIRNNAGMQSAPAQVTVVLQNSAESVGVTRNRYSVNGAKWDLRLVTTWFGAPLNPTAWCSLVRVGTTTLAQPRPIGIAPVDTAGAAQIQTVGTKAYNAPDFLPGVDVPTVPAGSYGIQCFTSSGGLTGVNIANTR